MTLVFWTHDLAELAEPGTELRELRRERDEAIAELRRLVRESDASPTVLARVIGVSRQTIYEWRAS